MRAWRVRTIVFCCALGLTVQSAARCAAGPLGRLAVTTVDRGAMWVAVVNADGSGLRRLTAAPGPRGTPLGRPGARGAAPPTIEGEEHPDLYVMSADGTDQRRLTRDGVLLRPGIVQPAWVPGSRAIAFVERIGRFEQQISIINTDGTGYRRFARATRPPGRRMGGRSGLSWRGTVTHRSMWPTPTAPPPSNSPRRR